MRKLLQQFVMPAGALALAASVFVSNAEAVTISAVASPAGPFLVGDEFDVQLSVTGWVPADGEVDAIDFRVDFDTSLVSFVAGSGFALADGTEFLALANQGGTYHLSDDTAETLVGAGRFLFGAFDDTEGVNGSVGPNGALGGFRLKAEAVGVAAITPNAPDPDSVFSDPGFFGIPATGGVTFLPASVVIIPEPSAAGLLVLGGTLLLVRRRRRA